MSMGQSSRLGMLSAVVIIGAISGGWWMWRTSSVPTTPVVIYLVDSLRADRLGIYGYTARDSSPNLTELAKNSVVFEQAYAAAPWTLPSVASMITSTFLCEHQIYSGRDRLSSSFQTLPEVLQDNGYFTGGAYSNLWVGPGNGLAAGYQNFIFTGGDDQEHAPEVATLLEEAAEKPFYLYLHSMEPHDTHATLSEYVMALGHVSVDLRMQYKQAHDFYVSLKEVDWEAQQPLGTTDNTAAQDRVMSFFSHEKDALNLLYDASVLRADSNLADVIAVLKENGSWDKTIFIFVSDHGEEIGDHDGWFHDQSVYEELTHIPMLIHFPEDQFGGQRISDAVSLLDIMPTVLDFLGQAELCGECRGRSLMNNIRGTDTPDRDSRVVQSLRLNVRTYNAAMKQKRGDVNIAVRDGRWKGIWNREPETIEVYDIETDEKELWDRSEENPMLAAALKDRAETWYESCLKNARAPEGPAEMDAKTKAELRAIGYLN
jgi:arylsulfatase A-like enzyme